MSNYVNTIELTDENIKKYGIYKEDDQYFLYPKRRYNYFVCKNCKKEFLRYSGKLLYCSNKCSKEIINEINRLDIDSIRKSFEKEGYKLLTKIYINNGQKLKFICPNGHKHSITWANWSSKNNPQRCKYCAKNAPVSWSDVLYLFKLKGWQVLTKENEWKNTGTKVKYKCNKGHVHSCIYSILRYRFDSMECPTCSNRITIEFDDIKKSFEDEGWIVHTKSNEYETQNKTQIDCECPNGHRQLKSVRKWRIGRRCSYCSTSGPELEVRKFIDTLDVKVIYNDRKKLNGKELDFYFPDIHKAIEFNGDYWHCNRNKFISTYFNKHKQLYAKDIWELDKNKANKCENIGIDLLIIEEGKWKQNNTLTMDRIKEFIAA